MEPQILRQVDSLFETAQRLLPVDQDRLHRIYKNLSSGYNSTLKQAHAIFSRNIGAKAATRTQQAWNAIYQSLLGVGDFFLRCVKAVKSSALWIAHLPKATITAISQWMNRTSQAISTGVHAILAAIKLFLKVLGFGILVVLSLVVLSIAVQAVVRIYRRYQHEEQLRIQRELRAKHRREEAERQARIREEAERGQRRAEEHRRQEQERKRREEAQRRRQTGENKRKVYKQWLAQREALFACREAMTRFPDPPDWPCTAACPDNEVLKACRHTIKRLYEASGVDDLQELLEKEKLEWHPDKFGRCPSSSREMIQAKVTEMFKIIQALLDESRQSRKEN
ncbi:hypothetical protein NA57DRAFT_72522 [Rhizodiscina lignyota]|uniref:Uncharacterized protein n=1 Tax=Rhizodiscina lignyota TaxID=1504668 RepID=A0A9P4ISP2_9PEZI|nr:hypothetical protein NA57DRAFT_72522 [Rhizodiscina lignyota]